MPILKQRIDVSAEMVAFVGRGAVPGEAWPADSLLLSYAAIDGDASPTLQFVPFADHRAIDPGADVILVVMRDACSRIFGFAPGEADTWHLPGNLRLLAQAVRHCDADPSARATLQLARSIELLCQTFAAIGRNELAPARLACTLSELDRARIVAARRMIDECWDQKLTLDGIARSCGLNRDKLARGFRAMYQVTVAEALADNRLDGARRMLLSTDLPVATIGYRCGYLNNASFARAIARRFGVAPRQLRQGRIAA